MESDVAIRIKNISKVYKLYDRPEDRFKETFHPWRKTYHHEFYALQDVSFTVKRGDTLGVLGNNGAGKSTLLQIIYQVLTPTRGVVEVNGKVSALLNLGSGVNPELTGIENAYFNGSIMGYSRQEMDERIDSIFSFADIGEFAHQPVKTYSSGMYLRLAFSMATIISPDILIVDEILSVGDIFFRAKCIDRMKTMLHDNNTTLIFVSHDLSSVRSLCRKSLLLDHGKLVAFGDTVDVVDRYGGMKQQSEQSLTAIQSSTNPQGKAADSVDFEQRASYGRLHSGKARLLNVQMLDDNEASVFSVEYEQAVTLRLSFEVLEDLPRLHHGYNIRNEAGTNIVHSNSILEQEGLENVRRGERYVIDWRFKISLSHFQRFYTIGVGLFVMKDYDTLRFDLFDYVPIAVQFEMKSLPHLPLVGLVHWDNEVTVREPRRS